MNQPWIEHYPKGVSSHISIPPEETLADLLETTCKNFAYKDALSCMGAQLTFRQLNRRADHLASYLVNFAGIKAGDRVAIMLPNIMQFPIALFATLKAGGVCVNTNPLYTPREMSHQFRDSGAKVLIVIDLFLDKVEEIIRETDIETIIVTSISDQLPFLKGLAVAATLRYKKMIPHHNLEVVPFNGALAAGADLPCVRPKISQDDVALLQYTGGTTGVSKGAMLTHKCMLANIYQVREWAKPALNWGDETVLTALPLYHIFALSVNFLSFLSLGAKMILVPKPMPIENVVKAFKSARITVMTGVNTLYNALNNNAEFRALAPSHLKIALAGGMALQEKVAKEFQAITGVKVLEGFGLTEASPVTHCNPLKVPTPPLSVGLPLPSTDAKIVDDDGEEVGPGVVGELVVRGPQIMKAYWKNQEETEKVLRDGWLYTGDIARCDEQGFFYIVDRKKDMIIVSGFNVYPSEVEGVLVSHSKVLEAAVVGEVDNDSGERVRAFIVAKEQGLTEGELREHCEKLLTGYKRPVRYEFCESLPKSNVGKILRRELRVAS